MNKGQGYTVLIIMVAAAIVCLAIGFLVIGRSMNSSPATKTAQTSTSESVDQTPSTTADWATYTNAKYGYSVLYPPGLKAGSVSGNSVLGDYQNPVKGFHIGPLVFVSLTGSLRKTGADYFNESYNLALHPPTQMPDGPSVSCQIDKINNTSVPVKSVSCTGEGGPSRYALILGKDYDVFVDDYSKGFDNTDNGDLKDPTDYVNILASFKFPTTNIITADATKTTPVAVQSFTVMADDGGASPTEITVTKDSIVDLTFTVGSSNVNHGGLEFKSSVINTGTIFSGTSKTIAFTATQSFEFTPYWPGSGITRPYTIKVAVQ